LGGGFIKVACAAVFEISAWLASAAAASVLEPSSVAYSFGDARTVDAPVVCGITFTAFELTGSSDLEGFARIAQRGGDYTVGI
jgi:hypothetical protein